MKWLEWLEEHQLPCAIRQLFGVNCPGCGMQRSVFLLLRGEWEEALAVYPPVAGILLFLLLVFLRIAGWRKISADVLKFAGFACLFLIIVSYLLQFISG